MLANSWSIALLVSMAATLFLIGMASITGVKILIFWDADSDSERQITLEGQTWLAAALVENGLAVQIVSFVLLIIAAGEFSNMIAGAMCATGSFLANEYGPWSLYVKIAGIFLYGFWIVLHRLDLRSENSPLIRVKFGYLLLLLPFLLVDGYLLFNYLYNLEPDIITSCCGVIFSDRALKTNFLLFTTPAEIMVTVLYLLAAVLFIGGIVLLRWQKIVKKLQTPLYLAYGIAFLIFFLLSLITITIFFSSYIYAMPYHNCPFDILHREYGYIGFPIYVALFGASFLAITSCMVSGYGNRPGLLAPVLAYRKFSIQTAIVLLMIFVALVTYPTLAYLFAGGEI